MKHTRNEKRQKASEIFNLIEDCESEEALETISDMLEDLTLAGYIFKKDYKFLSEELDIRLSCIVEKELYNRKTEL